MRIGIVKESLCIGGTERSASNISQALAGTHDVYTILFDDSIIQYPYGGQLISLSAPPKKSHFGKVLNSLIRSYRLRKVIRSEKIEIIFFLTGISGHLLYERFLKCVKIISCRDFGKISTRTKMFAKALCKSDAMISNSDFIKDYYLRIYPEHREKVFRAYNIIDIESVKVQSKAETNQAFLNFIELHDKTIVSVGRFCKEKGFEYLIHAFSIAKNNLSNVGLVLIGDGAFRDKYEEIITKLNLHEHVFFTGFDKNPYKYMRHCDVYVLSSLSEGFPNVLVEAMALSLPVIATNCYSGPAEILRDDQDYSAVTKRFAESDYGIITPRISSDEGNEVITELSNAIEYLLSNEELMGRYSILSALRAHVFSADAARESLSSIFEVLSERKKEKT